MATNLKSKPATVPAKPDAAATMMQRAAATAVKNAARISKSFQDADRATGTAGYAENRKAAKLAGLTFGMLAGYKPESMGKGDVSAPETYMRSITDAAFPDKGPAYVLGFKLRLQLTVDASTTENVSKASVLAKAAVPARSKVLRPASELRAELAKLPNLPGENAPKNASFLAAIDKPAEIATLATKYDRAGKGAKRAWARLFSDLIGDTVAAVTKDRGGADKIGTLLWDACPIAGAAHKEFMSDPAKFMNVTKKALLTTDKTPHLRDHIIAKVREATEEACKGAIQLNKVEAADIVRDRKIKAGYATLRAMVTAAPFILTYSQYKLMAAAMHTATKRTAAELGVALSAKQIAAAEARDKAAAAVASNAALDKPAKPAKRTKAPAKAPATPAPATNGEASTPST